jgi:hypothetical protein
MDPDGRVLTKTGGIFALVGIVIALLWASVFVTLFGWPSGSVVDSLFQ